VAEIVGTLVYVVGNENATGLGVNQFVHNGRGSFTIQFNFSAVSTCVEITSIAHWETASPPFISLKPRAVIAA
jgi:hypothetical protein